MGWLSSIFHHETETHEDGVAAAVEENLREALEHTRVTRSIFDNEGVRRIDEQTHLLIAKAMDRVVRGR